MPIRPAEVDARKLKHLCLRRNTYGDLCQGFADEEFRAALASAGNHVPGAMLILKQRRQEAGQVFHPPFFLDDEGNVIRTIPFRMQTSGRAAVWV
mmetsp:Transcript_83944/g.216053  ORF Transcript_83944/g.216053 Transcript_83944/m.216053 type:complete len:95 (+) Transcript_83944:476-760(+)